jgi:serine protease Do
MKHTAKTGFVLALLALALQGCLRATPARSETALDLTAEATIYPPADLLRDWPLERLITTIDGPSPVSPIDSQVMREAAARVSPSIVSIFTRTQTAYTFRLLPVISRGIRFNIEGEALGSGFFIHKDGYLLTNAHVIENATEIVVITEDGSEFAVQRVAEDPVYDLALLQVVNAAKDFPVLPLGDSDAAQIGDWVIAVGNPLGLGHTVTHGIISQTGRNLFTDLKPGERQISFLQTDTPINPGSSGGPLTALNGVVLGVNTATLINTQGISFCVPTQQVKEFLRNVLAGRGKRCTGDC